MDDDELIAATAGGDADAFAALYRRHLARIVGYLLHASGDREVAADLAAEVFAAALVACPRYRPQRASAAPWLIGIAQNKLRESRRRGRVENATRRRLQMAALPLGDDDLERVAELAALGEVDVKAAVDGLPPNERDAVRARSSTSANTGRSPARSSARSPLSASGSAAGWREPEPGCRCGAKRRTDRWPITSTGWSSSCGLRSRGRPRVRTEPAVGPATSWSRSASP